MDPAGADAPRADADLSDLAFDNGAEFLKIGEVSGFGLHVGVGDLVAGDRFLAANFTLFCHGFFLKVRRCLTDGAQKSRATLPTRYWGGPVKTSLKRG